MDQSLVLITGASGFIGTALVQHLLARGYFIVALSRQQKVSQHPNLKWITDFHQLDSTKIDYVINLAGESIGQGRWTTARKQQLLQSRVQTTQQLYDYLTEQQIIPKRIISGSAVGYYGIDETEKWSDYCDESAMPQSIFMSELCQQWEKVTQLYPTQNTKIIRLGVVFGQGGGILPQMIMPIKFNLVKNIATGLQPCVWVHLQDVIRAIEFLMLNETTQLVFNVVAPEQTSQASFAQTASQVLKRKPFLTLPAVVLKMMLGEQSQLVLNGQYVKPKALLDTGFKFQFPNLKQALEDLT